MQANLERLLNSGYAVTICQNFHGKHKYTVIVSDGFDLVMTVKNNNIKQILSVIIKHPEINTKPNLKVIKR